MHLLGEDKTAESGKIETVNGGISFGHVEKELPGCNGNENDSVLVLRGK